MNGKTVAFFLGLAIVMYIAGRCNLGSSLEETARASAATQATIDSLLTEVDSLRARPPDTVLVRRVVRAAARVDTAAVSTDSAIAQITDSVVRAAVDTAVARERAAYDERLAATVALYRSQIAVRDTVIDKLSGALDLMTRDRDLWRSAKAKDEWLNCTAGVSIVQPARGVPTTGVGVTCGIEIF